MPFTKHRTFSPHEGKWIGNIFQGGSGKLAHWEKQKTKTQTPCGGSGAAEQFFAQPPSATGSRTFVSPLASYAKGAGGRAIWNLMVKAVAEGFNV